jgi:hypothetical protein
MFEIGQVVCLWHEDVTESGVTVLKEVLVTLTDIKTGVPGEWSRIPSTRQSLRGLGDDGNVYDKHWDVWPETQLDDFMTVWSIRDDAPEGFLVWQPKEAIHAYNALNRHNDRHPDERLERRDLSGNPILPKGDISYCEKHDRYEHRNVQCFRCRMDERKTAAA